jgi:hypothetical protein
MRTREILNFFDPSGGRNSKRKDRWRGGLRQSARWSAPSPKRSTEWPQKLPLVRFFASLRPSIPLLQLAQIRQRASSFDELRETASASLRFIRKTKRKPPARRDHAPGPDACCLLSVQVAKIRLELRGTLEISVKKAKQEWRLTANAGKK